LALYKLTLKVHINMPKRNLIKGSKVKNKRVSLLVVSHVVKLC